MGHRWREWHLTPRGWEAGAEGPFGETEHDPEPPADRVVTIEHGTGRQWLCVWLHPDDVDEEGDAYERRKVLEDKWGYVPPSL